MLKYLSGRSKKTPQSGLSSDRYRYLSVGDAEPNIGDPVFPGDVTPIGQQYQVVSIEGYPGQRYWVPVGGGLIPGGITIYDEGNIVGGLSSTTQLNFVGAAITAQGIGGANPGIAATITVFAPGNNGELLFNSVNDFSTSFNLTFDSSIGILSAGNAIAVGTGGTVINTTLDGFVGIGTTNPTSKLTVDGNVNILGFTTLGIGATTPGTLFAQNLNIAGISTFNKVDLKGTVSAGNTVGSTGQYLMSTGNGVVWTQAPSILDVERTVGIITASQGQTSFNFSYDVGLLDVFVNGIKLAPSEYTATDGTTVVLNSPAFEGDIVEFFSYKTSATALGIVRNVESETSSAGQTNFNFLYKIGYLDVFVNGVKLTGSEYIANNGNTVILNSPTFEGDIVEFVSYYASTTYSDFSDYSSVSGISTISQNLTGNPDIEVGSIEASTILVSGISTVGLGTTSNPPNNSQLSFELISDTQLRIKVRGNDGILRSADFILS